MNFLKFISYLILLIVFLQCVSSSPTYIVKSSRSSPISYREVESQQVNDVQSPNVQEPISQDPIKQEPAKQEPAKQELKQEVKQQEFEKQEPKKEIKQQVPEKQEPINQEPLTQEIVKQTDKNQDVLNEKDKPEITETTTCTKETCVKHKPDYSKAISIAAKGNAIAAAATAGVAAPAILKSAKVAVLAGLIPIKLAAKGAIIGGLIAKPIIIKSAIVGATAAKLSHLFVGKPISIGANLLAGAEALRAKLAARRKSNCTTCTVSN